MAEHGARRAGLAARPVCVAGVLLGAVGNSPRQPRLAAACAAHAVDLAALLMAKHSVGQDDALLPARLPDTDDARRMGACHPARPCHRAGRSTAGDTLAP